MRARMLTSSLSQPIVSSILRDRRLAIAVSGFAGLNLALFALHLPSWQCPVLNLTGVPCPGCGLTRAIALLFQGQWRASITMHAFAPVFVVVLMLLGIAALLPNRYRPVFVNNIKRLEQKTAIPVFLLTAFFVYWLVRLVFFQSTFFQLIRG
jgi:hypothetical protein